MCVHTKTNLAAVGSWFPGLVHSALALTLASIALALGVLAVQPVAGHSFTFRVKVARWKSVFTQQAFSASLKRSLNLSANKYYYHYEVDKHM